MPWIRPAAELVSRFDRWLPQSVGIDRRQMFGCPCAFVNGNMFAGVHEHNLIVRLPQDRRERLLAARDAQPFQAMGRTMREYVAISDPLDRPPDQIERLIADAYAFASGLPPKVSSRKRSRP
ncbi:MAG TPA: TfoX/Sxy family protein [Burkholderiaceae bacterium]|jgi:TfoX/Sxy family transcriptional regulator of competence genes|nr:TfoX/Sxy family protein [Burkholderiaceae bacterium]